MMFKLPQSLEALFTAKLKAFPLQVRLTLGMVLIVVLGLGSLTVWVEWEIQQLAMNDFNPASPTLNDRWDKAQLLSARQRFRTFSLLSLATTVTASTWWIGRSLRPLRQMTDWAKAELAFKPFLIDSFDPQLPEIRYLVHRWNSLLAHLTTTQEQQRQLIDDLAHELRMPLSTVYGYLQRSQQRNGNLNEAQKESLTMAVEEAERMTQLLQDWLALARSRTFSLSFETEPFVLNDWVRKVAEMTEKFDRRRIDCQVPPLPIWVSVDRLQLIQILKHLLENAIQFSNEPISLELHQVQQWAILDVRDRGCGIPISEQARIFDPFYRIDPSRNRTTGGTGLGLSIVKSLVENMGGSISLQSQVGEGSTFTLKLPISSSISSENIEI
jgi:signal transduction histidine kinase